MNLQEQKTYIFHVTGMHCKACELVIEDEIKGLDYVTRVDARLSNKIVTVSGDFGKKNMEEIASELTSTISRHGYYLSAERTTRRMPAVVPAYTTLRPSSIVHVLPGTAVAKYDDVQVPPQVMPPPARQTPDWQLNPTAGN